MRMCTLTNVVLLECCYLIHVCLLQGAVLNELFVNDSVEVFWFACSLETSVLIDGFPIPGGSSAAWCAHIALLDTAA